MLEKQKEDGSLEPLVPKFYYNLISFDFDSRTIQCGGFSDGKKQLTFFCFTQRTWGKV